MRRNRKKKKVSKYPVRCIVLLSVEPQEGIDYVEKKENKQLKSDNCSTVGFERTLIYGKEKRTEGIVVRQGNV